ncbi:MAG: hypothetical protein R3362_08915 [Rhodothermales bacterium]|nr:hypothetical protein [Rhodothermales bacterium]
MLSAPRSLLVLVALVACTACGGEAPPPEPAAVETGPIRLRGTVSEVASHAGTALVRSAEGRVWSVSTPPEVPVLGPDGRATPLLPGFEVEVAGQRTDGDSIRPDSVRVLAVPPVVLVTPREGERLAGPDLVLEGFSEGGRPVRYRVLWRGTALAEGVLPAERYGVRRYGAFRGGVRLPKAEAGVLGQELVVEVGLDAEAGALDEAPRPYRRRVFVPHVRTVTLYFPNRATDEARRNCRHVYALPFSAPGLATEEDLVRLLIGGLMPEHERRGYYSELARFDDVEEVTVRDRRARVVLRGGGALDGCVTEAVEAQLLRTLGHNFGVAAVEVAGGDVVAARE